MAKSICSRACATMNGIQNAHHEQTSDDPWESAPPDGVAHVFSPALSRVWHGLMQMLHDGSSSSSQKWQPPEARIHDPSMSASSSSHTSPQKNKTAGQQNQHSFIHLSPPLSLLPARRFQSGHDQRLLRRSHMPVIRSIPENKRRVRTGCLSCRKRRRKCSYDPIPLISPCASGYFGWYPA